MQPKFFEDNNPLRIWIEYQKLDIMNILKTGFGKYYCSRTKQILPSIYEEKNDREALLKIIDLKLISEANNE